MSLRGQASFLGGQFSASRHPLDEATEDRQNLSPGQNHSGGSGRRPFSAGLDIELVSKHPRLTEEAVTMIKGLNCQYLPHASNLAESLKVVYESQKQQTSICQKITDLLENEFRAQITTFSQIKMENDETIRDLEAAKADLRGRLEERSKRCDILEEKVVLLPAYEAKISLEDLSEELSYGELKTLNGRLSEDLKKARKEFEEKTKEENDELFRTKIKLKIVKNENKVYEGSVKSLRQQRDEYFEQLRALKNENVQLKNDLDLKNNQLEDVNGKLAHFQAQSWEQAESSPSLSEDLQMTDDAEESDEACS